MSDPDVLKSEIEKRLKAAQQSLSDVEATAAKLRSEVNTYSAMLRSYRALNDAPPQDAEAARDESIPSTATRTRVRYLHPVFSSAPPDRVRYPRKGAAGEAVLQVLAGRPAGIDVDNLVAELRSRGHMSRSNDYVKSADWEVYNLIRQGWPIDRRLGRYRLLLDRCIELGIGVP
jgi:hypothetical protein